MTELAAEADGVLSQRIGKVVGKLVGLVWNGEQRPAALSTQLVKASNINPRHSEVGGIGHAGVDAKCFDWVFVVVNGEDGLPESVVAKLGCIEPASIRRPGPIHTDNLGAQLRR